MQSERVCYADCLDKTAVLDVVGTIVQGGAVRVLADLSLDTSTWYCHVLLRLMRPALSLEVENSSQKTVRGLVLRFT